MKEIITTASQLILQTLAFFSPDPDGHAGCAQKSVVRRLICQ